MSDCKKDRNTIEYWYNHTSMLGFGRLIKKRLPWYIRPFIKICVDDKRIDIDRNSIIVKWGFNKFPKFGQDLTCEFSLSQLLEESKGSGCITKETPKKKEV